MIAYSLTLQPDFTAADCRRLVDIVSGARIRESSDSQGDFMQGVCAGAGSSTIGYTVAEMMSDCSPYELDWADQ